MIVTVLRSGKVIDNNVGMDNKVEAPPIGVVTSTKVSEKEKVILPPYPQRLLDAIQQTPSYAKFLKVCCTKKRKFKEYEKVALMEEVSAVLLRKLPPKIKDPGSFTISCRIGGQLFECALLDLRASINLLPYAVDEKLNLVEFQPTSIMLQLADRSIKRPRGMVEDVLV